MCGSLPSLTNGSIIYSTDSISPYEFATMAMYICDTGFGLIGDVTRTCNGDDSSPDGMWTGQAPSCDGRRVIQLTIAGYALLI